MLNEYSDERQYFDLFGKTFLKSCLSCDMQDKDYLRFKEGKPIEEKEIVSTNKKTDT